MFQFLLEKNPFISLMSFLLKVSSEDSLNNEGGSHFGKMPKSWRRSLRKLAWKKRGKEGEKNEIDNKEEEGKGLTLNIYCADLVHITYLSFLLHIITNYS